jgi:2,4'-dihydroxyacetophenone dioxygenase
MNTNTPTLWTGHVHPNDTPWVATSVPGMELRLLQYREDADMMATELRALPFCVSGKHQHLDPAYAITLEGCWGHDHSYEYRPGTYVFEPIGVVHQFFAGPEPVRAIFIAHGKAQFIDEETGEVAGTLTVADQVAHYFQQCEAAGLPRPNILGG